MRNELWGGVITSETVGGPSFGKKLEKCMDRYRCGKYIPGGGRSVDKAMRQQVASCERRTPLLDIAWGTEQTPEVLRLKEGLEDHWMSKWRWWIVSNLCWKHWRAPHIWTLDENVLREDRTEDYVQALKRSRAAAGSCAGWLVLLAFSPLSPAFTLIHMFAVIHPEVASTCGSWIRCGTIWNPSFL